MRGLPAAEAFRRGGIAKTIAVVVIIDGRVSVLHFWVHHRILALFLIAAGIGGLALYEIHASR